MNTVDILGIDLGTTKSVVAVWDLDSEKPVVITNREGQRITPSIVAIDPDSGKWLVGQPARDLVVKYPKQVVYSAKRFIGRSFHEDWVAYDQDHVTYLIEKSAAERVAIRVGDRVLAPAQVSAEVLRKLKQDAELNVGRTFDRAVISVPAYFNESQRQATKEAGELAGLIVPHVISEPTAAALAFGLGVESRTVAVFDLGGGTFDISVLEIDRGHYRVRAIGGDSHLGGDDFDHAIVGWLCDEFERQHGAVPELNDVDRAQLRVAARQAKVELTDLEETAISISLATGGQRTNYKVTLSRSTLENLVNPFINKALDIVAGVLTDEVKVPVEQIDLILMVGGQTRMPLIRQALGERFGRPLDTSVEPEEVVALGAAVWAARQGGHLKQRIVLRDVLPLSLGIELADGTFEKIIRANESVPITRHKNLTTNREGQPRIQFRVYQGERPFAEKNVYIGELNYDLSIAQPKGARVKCTFKVDQDGILHVLAQEIDTESEPKETVFDHVYRLTTDQIAAHQQTAAEHRDKDIRQVELLHALQELQGKIKPEDDRSSRLQDAKDALDAGNLADARKILTELGAMP